MTLDDIRSAYRINHHRIEFSLNNVRNAGLQTYEAEKKLLVENIQSQIDYLNKIKEELKK